MKSFIAVVTAVMAVTVAADQTLSEILTGVKVCGWACLPSAAADNSCGIADLDCLCQTGEGGILSGTRVSSLTQCEKKTKFCGSEGSKQFDDGQALDDACVRFRSGKASPDEVQSMSDFISAHYASATAIVGSATASGAAPTATGTGKPAKTTDTPSATGTGNAAQTSSKKGAAATGRPVGFLGAAALAALVL